MKLRAKWWHRISDFHHHPPPLPPPLLPPSTTGGKIGEKPDKTIREFSRGIAFTQLFVNCHKRGTKSRFMKLSWMKANSKGKGLIGSLAEKSFASLKNIRLIGIPIYQCSYIYLTFEAYVWRFIYYFISFHLVCKRCKEDTRITVEIIWRNSYLRINI